MSLRTTEDLFIKAKGVLRQWERIFAQIGNDTSFDDTKGPTTSVATVYSTDKQEFVMRTEVVARSASITYSLVQHTGYRYDEDLVVSHDTALDFMESPLLPEAFTLINEMLVNLSTKTRQDHPFFTLPEMTQYFQHLRQADPHDLILRIPPSHGDL